jgi:hypothetical protein
MNKVKEDNFFILIIFDDASQIDRIAALTLFEFKCQKRHIQAKDMINYFLFPFSSLQNSTSPSLQCIMSLQ